MKRIKNHSSIAVTLLTLLFSTISLASEPSLSFSCKKDAHLVNGVSCCNSALTLNECRDTVEELPLKVQSYVTELQKKFYQNEFPWGNSTPNCYWNAYYFSTKENAPIEFKPLNEFVFFDFIKTHRQEITSDHFNNPSNLKYGDVIVFSADGFIREDIVENFVPKRVWIPYSTTEHAAVYIGQGLVFQKENISSEVFSIDTLEHAHFVYERATFSSPAQKGRLKIEVWR